MWLYNFSGNIILYYTIYTLYNIYIIHFIHYTLYKLFSWCFTSLSQCFKSVFWCFKKVSWLFIILTMLYNVLGVTGQWTICFISNCMIANSHILSDQQKLYDIDPVLTPSSVEPQVFCSWKRTSKLDLRELFWSRWAKVWSFENQVQFK